MQERVLLRVKAFDAGLSGCAIAATASLGHFYDNEINYNTVKGMLSKEIYKEGLYTYEQAVLLNHLGFAKVTIVTADMDIVDIGWNELKRKKTVIKRMRKAAEYWKTRGDIEHTEILRGYANWLNKSDENRLIIDSDFPKFIRRDLSNGRPVGASVTANSLYKMKKINDIKEEAEQHAVVLRGYDNKGVFVVDKSFSYKGNGKSKNSRGYYKIEWEKFLCNMPDGDLLLIG